MSHSLPTVGTAVPASIASLHEQPRACLADPMPHFKCPPAPPFWHCDDGTLDPVLCRHDLWAGDGREAAPSPLLSDPASSWAKGAEGEIAGRASRMHRGHRSRAVQSACHCALVAYVHCFLAIERYLSILSCSSSRSHPLIHNRWISIWASRRALLFWRAAGVVLRARRSPIPSLSWPMGRSAGR